MELLADAAWQWRPKATLTAVDFCNRCTVFALQYSDCAVLRVRWNASSPTSLAGNPRFLESEVSAERDLELHGHTERVVSVRIYEKDPSAVILCSASRDCVIVWRLAGKSRVTQSILVENLPAEPGWVTFDDTGTLAAVASERDVKIFVIERKEVLVTLEGHLARVTRGEFHPIHHHLLITTSEDRTFKIWDLAARALWFQSAVLSAFSILSVALNPVNGDAAFGFADGSIKVFAVLDGYAKELTAFNVENVIRKSLRRKQEADVEARQEKPQVISSLPPWARKENTQKISSGEGAATTYGSVDRFLTSDSTGNVYVGHDQAVRAIHWSHNDRMLVTVANDKTSRLWLADCDTSSLTLQGIAPPSSIATAAAAMGSMSSAKKATRQEVVEARFFYMDKFLLSACGNLARLHQFDLDEAFARASSSKAKTKKKNDVEVLENQSRKRRVAQWSFDDMQSVTSLACVNGAFLSSVAVIAGSDRSLRVLDVGADGGGRTVRVVRDAHSRAAHTVALPRPTCYASHPSNFYDLLLSSAPDSTTHLWDIRADNCVMRFCEHVNRVHTLGVAFSPCMRYVATGSEDRAAYIYDIRTGRRLVKLKGHSDAVTSVAFSPLHPQLATGSCDGTVRFYSSEEAE
ncbi:WD repeat-containing protein 27 [Phytophthora ramorum]|uniref:WD repeat-containing protein 27 n=1 Tax=Phytophthora ramorum TaxID=164328 RepID=UPI003097B2D8|nr:WD repeat-containing protein 27 [Phytophthora ramorum]